MKQLSERDTARVARLVSVIREGDPLGGGGQSFSDETARGTIAQFGIDCYNYGDARGFVKGTMAGILMLVTALAGVSWLTGVHFAPVPPGYHVEFVSDRAPLARIDE